MNCRARASDSSISRARRVEGDSSIGLSDLFSSTTSVAGWGGGGGDIEGEDTRVDEPGVDIDAFALAEGGEGLTEEDDDEGISSSLKVGLLSLPSLPVAEAIAEAEWGISSGAGLQESFDESCSAVESGVIVTFWGELRMSVEHARK